jgi:hypothetical protein
MTPDWDGKPVNVPYASFGDPQSLNLYSYVRNSPVVRIDPDGHNFASWNGLGRDTSGGFTEMDNEIDSEISIEASNFAALDAMNEADRQNAQRQQQAENLDSFADAAKSSAQKAGAVSSTKVGDVWVNAYGGTAAQRTDELAAFSDDLTHTDRGKEMLKTLEGRKSGLFGLWGSPKPFDIIRVASGGSYSYAGGQAIMLDYHDVGAAYTSAHPGGTYSLRRIFAHELGHAAMGNRDNGPGRMNNVNWNENVIMRQLGDLNDRTAY